MKLDAIKLGLATAIVFAGIWVICSLLVMLLPSMMMGMSGHMVHGDLSGMNWHMTILGFTYGLVAWSVISGAIASLIAVTYNKLI